jgi:tripartite-type tricarboxylate transporter receptor subunit TctC
MSRHPALRQARRSFVGGLVCCAGVAGIAALLPAAGFGEAAYPSRPVRLVVPFLPGGGADLMARLLSPHLQQDESEQTRWRNPIPTATRC